MSSKKWKKMLQDLAAEFGLVLRTDGAEGVKRHWKIQRPTGETITTCAATPKDERVIFYVRKDIKRALHNGPAHAKEEGETCP